MRDIDIPTQSLKNVSIERFAPQPDQQIIPDKRFPRAAGFLGKVASKLTLPRNRDPYLEHPYDRKERRRQFGVPAVALVAALAVGALVGSTMKSGEGFDSAEAGIAPTTTHELVLSETEYVVAEHGAVSTTPPAPVVNESAPSTAETQNPPAQLPDFIFYTVQQGDTLSEIADSLPGVDTSAQINNRVELLAQLNALPNADLINEGSTLLLQLDSE